MAKLSKKKVREAIPGSMGIYAVIANKCGVNRGSITRFLQKEKNENLVEEIKEEREKLIDVGEKKLIELINAGNFNAIKLLLITKGKDRGWIEKQEIESKISVDMDVDKLRKAIKDGTPYQ